MSEPAGDCVPGAGWGWGCQPRTHAAALGATTAFPGGMDTVADHRALPSYLSLSSAMSQWQRGGWSLGGAQGWGGWGFGRRLQQGQGYLWGDPRLVWWLPTPGACGQAAVPRPWRQEPQVGLNVTQG